mmetsp:Transcript_16224/g.37587  ORF Transcript_16224/g.37587 Transcript_16224/m.37587 type:complete len:264 (+) Transcript_16224:318-1109(+)
MPHQHSAHPRLRRSVKHQLPEASETIRLEHRPRPPEGLAVAVSGLPRLQVALVLQPLRPSVQLRPQRRDSEHPRPVLLALRLAVRLVLPRPLPVVFSGARRRQPRAVYSAPLRPHPVRLEQRPQPAALEVEDLVRARHRLSDRRPRPPECSEAPPLPRPVDSSEVRPHQLRVALVARWGDLVAWARAPPLRSELQPRRQVVFLVHPLRHLSVVFLDLLLLQLPVQEEPRWRPFSQQRDQMEQAKSRCIRFQPCNNTVTNLSTN